MTSASKIILLSFGNKGLSELERPENRNLLMGDIIRLQSFNALASEVSRLIPSLILVDYSGFGRESFMQGIRKLKGCRIPMLVVSSDAAPDTPVYEVEYEGWVEFLFSPVPLGYILKKVNDFITHFVPTSTENSRQASADRVKILEDKFEQSQNLIMLGKIASGVAHDFNNVLGGILGYAEMAKFKFGKNNSALERYTDAIIAFSKRAGDLSQEILSFARGSKKKTEIISMHSLLAEVHGLVSHSIDKRFRLLKLFNAESDAVLGDVSLIQNAVINIALNARDAMPNGGEIKFVTSNKTISEEYLRKLGLHIAPGEYLCLAVVDNGTGMEKDVLEKIFNPFFTTKEKGKGTGLGLSSAMNTVQKHNGTILADSRPGKGTVFELLFPLDKSGDTNKKRAGEKSVQRGSGHLLIIDDEEALREIISGMLGDYGFQVSTAADGKEAFEIYQSNPSGIDLVVIDMNLPDCKGTECFHTLKSVNPNVKAVLSTGFSFDDETEKILNEGVLGFIQKPFEIKQLVKLISDVLKK